MTQPIVEVEEVEVAPPIIARRRLFPRFASSRIATRLAPARIVERLAPVVVVSRRRPILVSIVALGVTGLLVLGAVSALSQRGRDPLLIAAAAPRPVAVASCTDLLARAEQTRELMARGQVAAARTLADAGLTQAAPAGCAGAYSELARLWYTADVDDLLAIPVADAALVRQAPARWAAIELRADQLGVPTDHRHPAMALAENAYDRGLWQLSDAAFRDAWAVGYAGAEGIEFRHALLRNWGNELATKGSAADVPQGLAKLMTAHAIAKIYNLKTDVACTDLKKLGVVDCSATRGDPDEPTLVAPRRAGA